MSNQILLLLSEAETPKISYIIRVHEESRLRFVIIKNIDGTWETPFLDPHSLIFHFSLRDIAGNL